MEIKEKKSKAEELTLEAKNFFNFYKKDVGEYIRKGSKVIYLDFTKLTEFSNKLAEEILNYPEETISLVELALEETGLVTNTRIRLINLPKTQEMRIRNIRSKNLNEMIIIEGIVRQASDVRPQVVNSKFECPSCGTIISVLQIEKKFREPSRCSCGRRGGFKLISKEMVDTQRLVIEESPESLYGGEQPKRINVFLKEDLVEPKMEEKTTPGSRVKIIGVLKEVPVPLQSGGLSTRFELAIEVNNIIPMEETFEELDIGEEDEIQILELSHDPKIFEKLAKSIIPSVWGYNEIKKTLVLQLFGGVSKIHSDDQKIRGDLHILLIGDPGVAKSASLNFMAKISPKGRYVVGKSASGAGLCVSPESVIMTDNGKLHKIKEKLEEVSKFKKEYKKGVYYDDKKINFKVQSMSNKFDLQEKSPSKIWKIKSPREMYKITTISGKKIEITGNTSLFTSKKEWIKSMNLKTGDKIATSSKVKVDGKEKYFIDLVDSNPQIIGIKKEVKKIIEELKKEFKTKRKISKEFNISEDKLYYNWIREDKKGCIKLNDFKKISEKINYNYKEKIDFVCLYNGKKHKIPKKLNKDFIYLSGIIAGDGDLRRGENNTISIRFSNSNKTLQEEIRKIIKNEFQLNFDVQKGNDKRPEATRFNSKIIGEVLIKLGIPLSPKSKKIYLSNYLLSLKNNILSEYIAGLYDSDGSIFIRKGKGSSCIELTTTSEKLARNLQFTFLRYNINSSIRERLPSNGKIKGKNKKWVLEIRQNFSIKNFAENIKLRHPEKKKKLIELSKKIKIKNSENISFEKIKFIEKIKTKYNYVYDLTINKTHNFLVNGILVHNTATVVRDEYLRGWSLEAGAMVLANKGLVCIDELEKMDPNDRSAMHEAMEQQCMMPDFKLLLSNGKEIEIGPLVDRLMKKNKKDIYFGKNCEILPVQNIKLLSTDFENHFELKADRISRHLAPKEFIKIELVNGREITVTPEHPCWIVEDGKIKTIAAEKLKEGIFFPIPSKIKINSKNYKKENDILCKIIGYYISDGCYELNRGKKTGIQFWNNDKTLIEDYKKSIETYFKINPIITKRKNQLAIRVISKKIIEEIKKLDKNLLEKGDIKKIPKKIMQFPNENIKYLLMALYDGDGSVSHQKRNGCRISFVSQNKYLEEQMSDLLLRFGIQSSIFKDNHSKVWRLDISGQENLKKFQTEINFLSQNKKQKLKEYLEKEKSYKTIRDIIPGCTDKINEIFKTLKINTKKELGHQIDLGVEKQRLFLQKLVLIAEKNLKTKLEYVEGKYNNLENDLKEIKKLAFGYARWVKIKKISKIKNNKTKWVYDVTIEPYKTFISNGMILHNTITISKANVQATLRAETSVLAAANPKFGRFDPHQPIAQQIDLPPTLINRFDVIFPLRDMPNKKKDEHIASHVLKAHQKKGEDAIIPRDLLRKYVAYSKQRIKPILTDEAAEEIKNFYVNLRNMPVSSESGLRPIPISARQLQAIIRMSEACAKIRLSKEVTVEDSRKAIEIMKYYLTQVGYDYESKTFDIDRGTGGMPASQRNKVFLVRDTINSLENKIGKLIPLEEIEKDLDGKLTKEEIDDALTKLGINGVIFKPKKGYISKT